MSRISIVLVIRSDLLTYLPGSRLKAISRPHIVASSCATRFVKKAKKVDIQGIEPWTSRKYWCKACALPLCQMPDVSFGSIWDHGAVASKPDRARAGERLSQKPRRQLDDCLGIDDGDASRKPPPSSPLASVMCLPPPRISPDALVLLPHMLL